jgi:hypothetical protein
MRHWITSFLLVDDAAMYGREPEWQELALIKHAASKAVPAGFESAGFP